MKVAGLLLCVGGVTGTTVTLLERPWTATPPWYYGSMALVIVLVLLALIGAVMVDDG